MPMTSDVARQLVLAAFGHIESHLQAYSGDNLIVNDDGKPSYCHSINVNQLPVDLMGTIQETIPLYTVFVISESAPITTLQFEILDTNTAERKRVNYLKTEIKLTGFRVYLQG